MASPPPARQRHQSRGSPPWPTDTRQAPWAWASQRCKRCTETHQAYVDDLADQSLKIGIWVQVQREEYHENPPKTEKIRKNWFKSTRNVVQAGNSCRVGAFSKLKCCLSVMAPKQTWDVKIGLYTHRCLQGVHDAPGRCRNTTPLA
jgi:hypothetical protein